MRLQWIEKYLQHAEQLVYQERLDEALSIMYDLLYDEPGYANTHNLIGWAQLYYNADLVQAERHLKAAVHFQAAYAPPYLHLGALCMRQQRYSDALAVLNKGLANADVNRVTFLEQIAQVYEVRREYRTAIRLYREALGLTVTQDADRFTESIRRCRKKRLAMMFAF